MEATCTDNLLRMLWTKCSSISEWVYSIKITKDMNATCSCCNACEQWECKAELILDTWASFWCADVANCINTNVATQNAIKTLLAFPSTAWNYILTIWAGGVITRTPYTPAWGWSNVPNKPTTPWVYELTIDGSGNATRTVATSGGTWTCADTENCIRTNPWVRDAIQDMIDASTSWMVTSANICSTITSAWCSVWASSAPEFRFVDSTNNCNAGYPSGSCTTNASVFTWTNPITKVEFDIEIVANNWAAEPDFTHFTWYYDYASWLFYWVQRRPVVHTGFWGISQMMWQPLNWVTQISAADSESFDTVVANGALSINQLSTTSFELRHNVFYSWTTSNTWYVRWTYKVY